MKKYMTRPVVGVIATAVLIGGLTPLLANASVEANPGSPKITVGTITASPIVNKEVVATAAKPSNQAAQLTASTSRDLTPASTKVVMNDEGKKVTRYNLRELALNDPDTLQILLKQQAEHLYIIVDEIDLDTHLQTFMKDHPEEWERIYQEYYRDIWLEVRFLEDQEIISVDAETKDNKVYIKGVVTPDVTKVVVTKPNGDTISVVPSSEHTFAVSFTWDAGMKNQYATVKAYAGSQMVDSESVKLVAQEASDAKLLLHALSVLDAKKSELNLRGIVTLPADKVIVSYNGEKKSVKVQKLWNGVGSFNVTLKDVKEGNGKALVEIYNGDKKLESTNVGVQVINAKEKPGVVTYSLTGTAVLDAKQKKIKVNGTIAGWNNAKKNVSLVIVAPNGEKKVVKPNAHGQFTFTFSQKGNKNSFDGKAVHLQLYVDGKQVLEKEIEYNHEVSDGKQKQPQGNAYGNLKNKDKKSKKHDDDDDDDEDEDED